MKLIVLPFALILAVYLTNAQPVFQSSNLPTTGDQITYNLADSSSIASSGAAGSNVRWDFSGVRINGDSMLLRYEDPTRSPYADVFPEATVAEQNADTWSYFERTGSTWTRLGESSDFFQGSQWTDPLTIASFPWVFGQQIVDEMQHIFISDGTVTRRNGQITSTYDGYGTLILPQGSFENVMRIHYDQVMIDSSEFPVGPSTVDIVVTSRIQAWIWYQPGKHQPLFAMDTTTIQIEMGPPLNRNQITQQVHVQVSRTSPLVSVRETASGNHPDLEVHPNPAVGDVVVTVGDHANGATILVMDPYGRVVDSSTVQNGENRFHLGHLPAGVYHMVLRDERQPVNVPLTIIR